MDISTVCTEADRLIYNQEFRDWLPQNIFDAHVHVFARTSFPDDYRFPEKSCYRKFGCQHTFEQCIEITKAFFPDRNFRFLSFGTPDDVVDIEKAAKYTGEISDHRNSFGLTMISPNDNINDVERRIREYKLYGYKPYRNFVNWMDYEDVTIFDMISDEQMQLANQLGLIIVFHIPKAKRLADPTNQRQMVEFCNKYPNAKVIWAHIGRAYYMENVIGFLDGIAECPNAYVDTAMVNHAGVLEYTFNNFPRERIIFGSDAPIAWLRGKSVEINNQYAYLMGEDYAIGSTIYDVNHVVEFTSFYYEQIRGIKQACERANLSRQEIDGFFHNNIVQLLSDVSRKVHENE